MIQLYLLEESSITSLSKHFKVDKRRISDVLRNSDNEKVLYKLKHPNKGKHILKPKRNKDKQCEICGATKEICFNSETEMYLCNRHRQQIYKYGKILERTKFEGNNIIEYDDFAEIIIRNKDFIEIARATISLDKVNKVKSHTWHLHSSGYVECRTNKVTVLLHRFLMDVIDDKDIEIDHINRNKLDNRNDNLRKVCRSENLVNKDIYSNNTSGTTGVTWDKSRNKWKVSLNIYGNCYNLGRFESLDEAIKVRQNAELKYHKEFAPIERR